MATFEKEYVMFLVGRMNPPTPGHIRGLCIPFLRALRVKCVEILGEDSEGLSLVDLARRASVAPRLFLTNSTNEKRISYLSGARAALYDNVNQIVKDKTTTAQMKEGIFYVKDKQLENPLDPERKKLYVVEMLRNELTLLENQDIMVPNDILNLWIVCQTTGIESWCASNGPASAIKCALMLSKTKKYDNVFFFMGVDEDPSEMARRIKFCQDSERENEDGAKVKCVKLERINTVDQEEAADAAEAIADGSMSASKIRLLCASGDVATLHRLYNGLLEDTVINSLINDVREGLRLPPVSEIKAIAPPLPPRRSGRNQTMAGPREADTTSRAVMSGWTDVQRPPGSNAIGMSGVEHVRKIESEANPRNMNKKMKSLHLPSPSQGEKVQMSPPMDGKHGGRKTKRSRNKNKGSTKKRRKKSKAVHKKSKRRRLGKKNGTRRRARR